ncbi:hypothetical protein VTH82DRAFT_578 [Thermothelomyces myriococcoides]
MFICRGCLRSLTSSRGTRIRPQLLSHPQIATTSVSGRRAYTANGPSLEQRRAIEEAIRAAEQRPSPLEGSRSSGAQSASDSDGDLAYDNVNPKADEYGKQKYEKTLEASVRKVLSLTTDPYHIAQHVARVLEKGRFDEALMTARMASRNNKVEVSWNHLIDYLMKNHRLHAAVKLYNEMKKRAQIPNAKTYTIIFRGCAESPHPKLAVAEATRIYNFMIKYGPLKPNTIHMNAVLEVCARAGDLESLFTVLATCNANIRAPDAHTYTIVLNALKFDMGRVGSANFGLIDAEVRREIQKNIQKARAIWSDVIANWRSAKMIIDEPLVTAMGRVLAMGDYKDNESVLELLEQTMNIPRFDKPNVKLPDVSADAGTDVADPPAPGNGQTVEAGNMSPKERRTLASSMADKSPLYAKPGNKTLSLIFTVLSATRRTSSASKYWNYFTNVLKITPDQYSYNWYLRTLTTGHASGQVAELIASMPTTLLTPVTFRRGFTACIRDNLNQHAFKNACRIFEVMISTQRYPDALAMRLYLQVARGSTRHFYEESESESKSESESSSPKQQQQQQQQQQEQQQEQQEQQPQLQQQQKQKQKQKQKQTPGLPEPAKEGALAGKAGHGAQILTALSYMWEPFRILAGSLSYPEAPTRSPQEELERKRGPMQEMSATARRMIAAIDRVITDEPGMGAAGRDVLRLWRARRAILQRQLERYLQILYPDRAAAAAQEERDRRIVLAEEELYKRGEGTSSSSSP